MELKNTTQPSTQEENKKKISTLVEAVPSELVGKEDYTKLCLTYLRANNIHLTEEELIQFVVICFQNKLNPWRREAYAVKYGTKPFQVITGYQVYIERAEKTGLLDWWEVELVEEPIHKTETGKEINPLPKPLKAIFRGKRKDSSREISFTYWFREWDQKQATWNSKPFFMLEKVAISNSFRRWFSIELGGLPYTQEENWSNLDEANKQIEAQNKTIEKQEKDKEVIKNAF